MSFKITILGSSGAVPAYGRFPSAQLVEIQNEHFLVDCGEGAQMQLAQVNGNIHRIDHIFISHLHGDHYLGLMGLLFTMHLHHREKDLHIYSQHGLHEIITTQLRYSRSVPNYNLVLHTLAAEKSEMIFENKWLTVETVPLYHKLPCTGFLFREKPKPRRIDKSRLPEGLPHYRMNELKAGADLTDYAGNILYKNSELTNPPHKSRSYAYCSDTAYTESIVEQIRNVDVLYHEATFIEADKTKADETLHSTAQEAARIAAKAKAGRLLLGHFSARYRELDHLLAEARPVFPESYLATEGQTFTITE
ncbi:ribonuclease Z [Oscillatoria amoena NRMC-F 0135]|nr:ribonuclease Z [Oscillatoria amoena NRMC-F 0135]